MGHPQFDDGTGVSCRTGRLRGARPLRGGYTPLGGPPDGRRESFAPSIARPYADDPAETRYTRHEVTARIGVPANTFLVCGVTKRSGPVRQDMGVESFADGGGDLGSEEFGGAEEFGVGQRGDRHLEAEAVDAAEGFAHAQHLFGDGGGVADQQGAGGLAERFELAAGDGGPAALAADLGEGFGVAGEEIVGGLAVGFGDVAEGVDADLEVFRGMSGAAARLAVEVDERAEAVRLAADDRDHEREAERAGAGEGLRGATDAEPDGNFYL